MHHGCTTTAAAALLAKLLDTGDQREVVRKYKGPGCFLTWSWILTDGVFSNALAQYI